jgi:pilus assembly protein Flp/PilA
MLARFVRSFPVRKAELLRLDNKAVTAIEYGLIAALIAVVIIAAVNTLGTNLSSIFSTVASEL